eukprot:GHVU01010835.1.p1 GENE.GHVU01010835.1~~GHVU01010835.1.p1  ORF type:complete len:562 (+),score=112.35 GHVU01010835.1:1419-3104(+)
MGPSGCGKTTLLDMLANKKTAHYTGDVYVNGKPRDPKLFSTVATYVPQEDLYNGNERVREVLEFCAELRMPMFVGSKEDQPRLRAKYVDVALKALGLAHVSSSFVGNSYKRGISGGQKRRLTLGKALMSNSFIAFCDEPTSGLSSSDSELVIKFMKQVAMTAGITFVVVIHQPRNEVFRLFDQLVLVSQGRCIYNGPVEQCLSYFEEQGFTCPDDSNPADFLLDIITPGVVVNDKPADPQRLADTYDALLRPGVAQAVEEALARPHTSVSTAYAQMPRKHKAKEYGSSSWTQFCVISLRNCRNMYRDTHALIGLVVEQIAAGILMGLVFLQVRQEYKHDAFYWLSAMMVIVLTMINSTLAKIPNLVSERVRYVYEVSDNYYTPVPYIISQLLVDNIVLWSTTMIFMLLAWALMGFYFIGFPYAMVIGTAGILALDALISLCGVTSSTFQRANSVANIVVSVFGIFNGFLANPASMPLWFGWICYLSPPFYIVEGLSIELLGDLPNKEEWLNRYGFAGRAYKSTIDAGLYKWIVDVPVLLGLFVLVRVAIGVYQAKFLKLKR